MFYKIYYFMFMIYIIIIIRNKKNIYIKFKINTLAKELQYFFFAGLVHYLLSCQSEIYECVE